MSDYLPSEIRYKNEEARRKALEFDLRQRIRTEINFMSLRQEDRDAVRQQYLASRDFDPDVPMRDNHWLARLAYHRNDLELIRDHDFMAFYLERLSSDA
jgi:hypothetical protein